MPNTDPTKKTIWERIKGGNYKMGLLIAFMVGYNEFMPLAKDMLGFNDDMEAVAEGCNSYTDLEIENEKEKAQKYLDILLTDIYKINKRYEKDSIAYSNKHNKFAVGFRSDLNGIMSYRDRFGVESSTRINHEKNATEFYSIRKDKWDRCFFEDL